MFYKIFLILLSSLFVFSSDDIKNISSFQSKFIQTINSASNDIIEYEGEVFIKNNGKILWKYQKPVLKNVYINNNSAIVEEPELEQAIFTSLDSQINIIKLLEEAKKIQDDKYEAKINDVLYNIYMEKNIIKKISYKDNLENIVNIVFFETKQNIHLDDSIFIFYAPKNYDLIRK